MIHTIIRMSLVVNHLAGSTEMGWTGSSLQKKKNILLHFLTILFLSDGV